MYNDVIPHGYSEECETTRLLQRSTNCIASFHELPDATINLTNRYRGLIYTLHEMSDDDIHWLYRCYDMPDCHRARRSDLTCARQIAAGLAPVLDVTPIARGDTQL